MNTSHERCTVLKTQREKRQKANVLPLKAVNYDTLSYNFSIPKRTKMHTPSLLQHVEQSVLAIRVVRMLLIRNTYTKEQKPQ